MVFGKGITSFSDAHTINARGGCRCFFRDGEREEKTSGKKNKFEISESAKHKRII
jgi:hypothetical protein